MSKEKVDFRNFHTDGQQNRKLKREGQEDKQSIRNQPQKDMNRKLDNNKDEKKKRK